MQSTQTNQHINPAGVAENPGIHHVVVSRPGTTIRIGGQVGVDADGNIAGDDHASQARQAARNLRICLAAAGATPADLVRVRAFLVGVTPEAVEQFEAAAIAELDGWPAPTATLIGVESLFLPGLLVEIDAEAVLSDG